MKCETLDVWKTAVGLSVDIYKFFSTSRDFGFKDQITRSGLSVASNIAEGMEKQSYKEQVRFLDIAKGSAAELQTQIIIGKEIEYISVEIAADWLKTIDHVLSMLTKLQNYLKSKY